MQILIGVIVVVICATVEGTVRGSSGVSTLSLLIILAFIAFMCFFMLVYADLWQQQKRQEAKNQTEMTPVQHQVVFCVIDGTKYRVPQMNIRKEENIEQLACTRTYLE